MNGDSTAPFEQMEQEGDEHSLVVHLSAGPLPFFSEYPYFLWGEVNYDSDGDCQRPTDRSWTELWLQNRDDDRHIYAVRTSPDEMQITITGVTPDDVKRAAYLTSLRTGGGVVDTNTGELASLEPMGASWRDLSERLADADEVRAMFLDAELTMFDDHAWWGGWKWKGDFATDFTMGLRQTIKAVHARKADGRTLAWLQEWWQAPPQAFHREGVRHALRVLTGTEP